MLRRYVTRIKTRITDDLFWQLRIGSLILKTHDCVCAHVFTANKKTKCRSTIK